MMLVYMLQREQAAEDYDFEYDPDDAIWTDLNAIYAYISNELDIESTDELVVEQICDNPRIWVLQVGNGDTKYHITELQTMP